MLHPLVSGCDGKNLKLLITVALDHRCINNPHHGENDLRHNSSHLHGRDGIRVSIADKVDLVDPDDKYRSATTKIRQENLGVFVVEETKPSENTGQKLSFLSLKCKFYR